MQKELRAISNHQMDNNQKDKPNERNGKAESESHYEASGYGQNNPDDSIWDGDYQPLSDAYNTGNPADSKSEMDIMEEEISRKSKYKKLLVIFWGLMGAGIAGAIILFAGISLGWFGFMPTFEELEDPQTFLASEIYSHDGELMGTYYVENRSKTNFAEISPNLINALIATEDIRFYEHSGIDAKALVRVAYGAVTGQNKGGGSTITQQLAKNLFPREFNQSSFQLAFRKFKEWVIAVKLEQQYSKDEIITMYLDKIDFLNLAVGIKTASRVYFSTIPADLDVLQSAMLVGIVQNPSLYNPLRRPGLVIERRNVVLSQMVKYGYLDAVVSDSLKREPLGLEYQRVDHNIGIATYFKEYLRGQMMDWCRNNLKADGTPYDLYRDGLRIHTTIDARMQRHAEDAVYEHLGKDLQPAFFTHWRGHRYAPFVFDPEVIQEQVERLMHQAMRRSERYRKLTREGVSEDSILVSFNTPTQMTVFSWEGNIDTIMTPMDSIRYFKHFLRAGMMAVDPASGQVRAYVGGPDYRYFKYDQVMQARRQVGSTFKPFLYTLAMQEGATTGEFSPCTYVPNIPVSIELPDGTYWTPRNSSREKEGEMVTLKWALAHSINWISAYLMKRFSPLALTQLAQRMGITSDIPPVPAIALGTPDISVYEMVGAMNTYANKGIHVKPFFVTRIEDKYGNTIGTFFPETNEAMNEETAYLMIRLMQGVVETGTGIRLRFRYGFRHEIAGKTGTTQNNSDGWFIGIVPQLTAGVWVGCEDRSAHFRTITLGQGANMALPIWALFMQKVYDDPELDITKDPFPPPSRPLKVEVDCDKYDQQFRRDQFYDSRDF